jgi:outer membrane lipoprotein-sorting protein
MSKRKTLIVMAMVFLAMTNLGQSQGQKDAHELLKKVSETYGTLTSYHFEGAMITKTKAAGIETKIEIPITLSAVKPGKMRYEMKNPMMGMLMIFDGQAFWTYTPAFKKYTRKVIGEFAGENIDPMELGVGALLTAGITAYYRLAERIKEAKIVREELVEVNGKSVDCYVVEVSYELSTKPTDREPAAKTFWIDKARYIVLRETSAQKIDAPLFGGDMQTTQTTSFRIAKINESPADTLFIFTPPEDAKEVEELVTDEDIKNLQSSVLEQNPKKEKKPEEK